MKSKKIKISQSTLQSIKNEWVYTIDAILDWVCLIDLDSTILRTNRQAEKYVGLNVEKIVGLNCCKLLHGTKEPIEACPIPAMIKSQKRESIECRIKDGRWIMVSIDPVFDKHGNLLRAVHIARDITDQKKIENEKEKSLKQLQQARNEIKELSGLLPICSHCKNIRDDNGYWNQIEEYIQDRTEAQFSHSICPECSKKYYSDFDI